MPKLIRVTNASVVGYLKEYLAPSDMLRTVEELEAFITSQITEYPATTFCMVSVDEETIEAFVLATQLRPHEVRVVQTYAGEKTSQRLIDQIMLRLVLWCEQNEVARLRFEDNITDKRFLSQWEVRLAVSFLEIDVMQNLDNKFLQAEARPAPVSKPAEEVQNQQEPPEEEV